MQLPIFGDFPSLVTSLIRSLGRNLLTNASALRGLSWSTESGEGEADVLVEHGVNVVDGYGT
jgi:hypothetical protein